MHNFSIKVDLSKFFNDERSCSLVLVDATWANVKDLQDHIQKLFNLKDISLMTDDGCYLPPKESIKVVKSTHSLKAFQFAVPNDDLADPLCSQSLAETSRKRKNRSLETETELSCSTPNLPKRSKCKNQSKDEATFVEPAAKTDTHGLSRKSAKGNNSKRPSEVYHDDLNASDISSIPYNDFTTTATSTTATATATAVSAPSTPNQSKQLQTTTANRSSVRTPNTSNKHIKYNDDEEEMAPENVTAVETTTIADEVEFRCPLMELDRNAVRVFKLPRKSEPLKILEEIVIPSKVSTDMSALEPPVENEQTQVEPMEAEIATAAVETEVQEKVKTPVPTPPPSPEHTQSELESSKIEEEPLAEEPKQIAEQSLLDSDSDDDIMVLDDTIADDFEVTLDIIEDMLQNAAPLTNLPNVGETLIFKLAKTKGAKQPSPHTNYIAGTCSYINRRTKAIKITVIAHSKSIDNILRQYCISLNESSESTPVLSVNFRDLIDAKVIVASVD